MHLKLSDGSFSKYMPLTMYLRQAEDLKKCGAVNSSLILVTEVALVIYRSGNPPQHRRGKSEVPRLRVVSEKDSASRGISSRSLRRRCLASRKTNSTANRMREFMTASQLLSLYLYPFDLMPCFKRPQEAFHAYTRVQDGSDDVLARAHAGVS